jgi:uncharacterized OB-fold protein
MEKQSTMPGRALRYLHCRWCGSTMEAGRVLCPVCAGTDLEERICSGLGTVRRAGTAVRATEQWLYRVRQPCVIKLDEGFALSATLCADQYAAVPVGARVRVTATAPDAGPSALPEFRLL